MRKSFLSSLCVIAIAAGLITPGPFAVQASATSPIAFLKGLLQGERSRYPTSLQWGPDGRLYVAQQFGLIWAYTITRNGPADYVVSSAEKINLIRKIPNHNDDGTLNPNITDRQLTGILVTGTAAKPVIYASSSDPRFVLPRDGGGDSGLDTNSGMISRLTLTPTGWQRLDLVRGLPRSEEVHATNGLALDESTNTLYATQGGHTNAGAPSQLFGFLPEYAYSAAVLSIDLNAIGNTTYDLPTLDDPTRPGNPDANDPFGGNDGLNQARITPSSPVQVYSPGYRNPFDIIITSADRMYVTDNGGNAAHGSVPVNEGPQGNCTNDPVDLGGVTTRDTLHLVTQGYYGGYPNPTRGNAANTFGGQSPIVTADARQCDFLTPGVDSPAVTMWNDSTNGIAEYTGTDFGGALTGDLLTVGWGENSVNRVKFASDGTTIVTQDVLFSNVGRKPLDVTTTPDAGPFPGTIWVTDHHWSRIWVYEPTDASGCTGADDPGLDEDHDGYNNADEIDNGTAPCSAADSPPDFDNDKTSDLNDPDDDNDGIPDLNDPFARDKFNGSDNNMPISITWDAGDSPPGGIEESGFDGLMTNGVTDYLNQFDTSNMTIGGAAGVLTIDQVPDGDATAGTNTQQYGFQIGVPTGPTTGAYTVHARVLQPFAGIVPQPRQSMGIMFGTGSQHDYVKLVIKDDGVQFRREVGDVVTATQSASLTLPGPDFIDLFLKVNPGAGTVAPSYRVREGGTTGPRTQLGGAVSIPKAWLTAATDPAAGLISTSAGAGSPFAVAWDFFQVVPATPGTAAAATTSSPAGANDEPAASTSSRGNWEPRASSGLARLEVSYVADGGKLYLAWGGVAHQVYNPRTDRWRSLADLPEALNHIQAVKMGSLIYYIGGLRIQPGQPKPSVGTVYIYDPATDSLSTGAPMPEGRERGAGGVAAYGGKIYYAGGLHDGVAVPWVDVYDPVLDTWSKLPDMPRARDHFQAAVVDGKFWAIGGRAGDPFSPFGYVDAFDLTSQTWSSGYSPLPTPRGGYAVAVEGGEILVIGGEGVAGKVYRKVQAFDPVADTWQRLAPMTTPRHGFQAAEWHGLLFVAAGGTTHFGGGTPTDLQEVFIPPA